MTKAVAGGGGVLWVLKNQTKKGPPKGPLECTKGPLECIKGPLLQPAGLTMLHKLLYRY